MSMIGNLLRVTNSELEKYIQDSSLLENRVYDDEAEEDSNLVDIDKSWEGILFLLTGQNLENSDHPLARALFSGQFIDKDQDLGYGPAQYLTPGQVKEVNAEISKLTIDEISKNYDPKKMSELDIYPNIWNEEESLEYLTDYFRTLQEVYLKAAQYNQAVITFLN
ncbi:YfbM family protein [Pontibacter qinzhouensis]|nr:YfbM family protein [Pontibacter qinzhouensis]